MASKPKVLIGWFRGLGLVVARIGLEASPLSQWLHAGMREARLTVELLETRHVRDAFRAMPVKTDRKDAHCPADAARLVPPGALQVAAGAGSASATGGAQLLQTKNHDVEMSLHGVLRGLGLKVDPTPPRTFAGRIRELVAAHITRSTVSEALLAARDTLFGQWQQLERRLRSFAREDRRVRPLTLC